MAVVYEVRISGGNGFYIGGTTVPERRKYAHLCKLRNGSHYCKKLQSDYDKYGDGKFRFDVLEVVESKSDLKDREQFWIDRYISEIYNISRSSRGPSFKRSDDFKRRRSEIMMGNTLRRGKTMPNSFCEQLSKKLIGNQFRKGIMHTLETKKKISESLRKACAERRNKNLNMEKE